MKKVGIVSCYFQKNYGSMLQAYATKKVLDNNNIPNETINIDNNKDFKKGKRKYYLTKLFDYKFIKAKFGMAKLKLDKKINKELGKNIGIRNKKYNEFKREFNLSRRCKDYSDLTRLASEKYNNIIVGSDQLWLPVNVVADYYTLNWVPEEINKISYATSFGVSKVPNKYYEKYTRFLKRINHLSTREESGVKLIKDIAGIEAKLVADPTLLLTKDEWEKETDSKRIIKEKYILCYYLGSNIEHRKFAERLREETGCKIVSLNHADEYVKYSDKFCDYALYDIGPREWINLVKNAEYVCTDSFHGTVFAITFNKIFFDFRRYNVKSKVSTNSRIDSLLHVAGISTERILTGKEDAKEVLNYKIDYNSVNKNIDKFRQDSKKWLLDAIDYEEDTSKHINITDKADCCGCTACMNICPKKAIEMEEDEEGFLYPHINKEKCVDCGLCKKTCPILNNKITKKEQKGYILNNKDLNVRKDSTSGGFITPIAEYIIDKGGVVFGAAFDEKLNVFHKKIDKKEEIYQIRKSKYVQSDLRNSFVEAKAELENGKWVLFTGTPCQVEGLLKYLGKKYSNLITVDLACRSIPSCKFYRKYKGFVKKNKLNNEEITNINFRDKSVYGYKYSVMTCKSANHTISRGQESDPFLRAFFSDLSVRPSCYSCAFKKNYPESDFRIWDCFFAEYFEKRMGDNLGTTRLLINSSKGIRVFGELSDEYDYVEIPVSQLINDLKELRVSVSKPKNREQFFKDMNSMEVNSFFNKYFSNNIKIKMKRFLKIFLAKTGLYNRIKHIVYKIKG